MKEEFKCGNLRKNKLWEIWQNSQVLKSIRNLDYIPEDCKKCKFDKNCKGGDISFLNLGPEYKKKNLTCPHDPTKNEYHILE